LFLGCGQILGSVGGRVKGRWILALRFGGVPFDSFISTWIGLFEPFNPQRPRSHSSDIAKLTGIDTVIEELAK
jgi:hypothetical protein